MKAIIQEEATGCGIASVANIAGVSYSEAKALANSLDIYAEDEALYSDTQYVRRLLQHYGFQTADREVPFSSWSTLPDTALLAIKHHLKASKPHWHWVVFKRQHQPVVLDSASYLEQNIITDFSKLSPQWYIAVSKA